MSYKQKAIEAVKMMFDIDGYREGDAVSRRAVICVLDSIEEEASISITLGKDGICIKQNARGVLQNVIINVNREEREEVM